MNHEPWQPRSPQRPSGASGIALRAVYLLDPAIARLRLWLWAYRSRAYLPCSVSPCCWPAPGGMVTEHRAQSTEHAIARARLSPACSAQWVQRGQRGQSAARDARDSSSRRPPPRRRACMRTTPAVPPVPPCAPCPPASRQPPPAARFSHESAPDGAADEGMDAASPPSKLDGEYGDLATWRSEDRRSRMRGCEDRAGPECTSERVLRRRDLRPAWPFLWRRGPSAGKRTGCRMGKEKERTGRQGRHTPPDSLLAGACLLSCSLECRRLWGWTARHAMPAGQRWVTSIEASMRACTIRTQVPRRATSDGRQVAIGSAPARRRRGAAPPLSLAGTDRRSRVSPLSLFLSWSRRRSCPLALRPCGVRPCSHRERRVASLRARVPPTATRPARPAQVCRTWNQPAGARRRMQAAGCRPSHGTWDETALRPPLRSLRRAPQLPAAQLPSSPPRDSERVSRVSRAMRPGAPGEPGGGRQAMHDDRRCCNSLTHHPPHRTRRSLTPPEHPPAGVHPPFDRTEAPPSSSPRQASEPAADTTRGFASLQLRTHAHERSAGF